MRSTEELRTELTTFTAIMQESLGPRVRVQRDAEGCPFVQGRTGRLEWRGARWTAPPASTRSRIGRR
jgi:hypothetical protein